MYNIYGFFPCFIGCCATSLIGDIIILDKRKSDGKIYPKVAYIIYPNALVSVV